MTLTYVRHSGAMPTRGLEALGMGCAVVVQEESALRLFGGESEGVVSYAADVSGPARAIERVLTRWDDYCSAAQAGAVMVRREFALERVASQYFRFLTVLAARPREARIGPAAEQMLQKRAVVQRGWLPSTKFGKRMLMNWAAESAARIERQLKVEESSRLLNDLARERLLAHYHDPRTEEPPWLRDVDRAAGAGDGADFRRRWCRASISSVSPALRRAHSDVLRGIALTRRHARPARRAAGRLIRSTTSCRGTSARRGSTTAGISVR